MILGAAEQLKLVLVERSLALTDRANNTTNQLVDVLMDLKQQHRTRGAGVRRSANSTTVKDDTLYAIEAWWRRFGCPARRSLLLPRLAEADIVERSPVPATGLRDARTGSSFRSSGRASRGRRRVIWASIPSQ